MSRHKFPYLHHEASQRIFIGGCVIVPCLCHEASQRALSRSRVNISIPGSQGVTTNFPRVSRLGLDHEALQRTVTRCRGTVVSMPISQGVTGSFHQEVALSSPCLYHKVS
ncbi:unnamed protein product, partial [Ectocarpus sp. 4 AP-2014]